MGALLSRGNDDRQVGSEMGPADIKEADLELSPEPTSSRGTGQSERAVQSPSPTESTPALAAAERPSGARYKVYRRRFFGLGQLVLLNIIVSWDWISFAPVSKSAAQYLHRS